MVINIDLQIDVRDLKFLLTKFGLVLTKKENNNLNLGKTPELVLIEALKHHAENQ